jgi:hypothetical protein
MAIQISGTTVIDDSRNYTGITSVSTGIASTQTWNSGQSSINIDGTTGNIKIDGILKARNLIILPKALALGDPYEGGYLICQASSVQWIVAPSSAEVSRDWYSRNDANIRAQQVSGCTGWFVPTCGQLQNPGYTCRTYWDSYSTSTSYWSSTETNSGNAWLVFLTGGATINLKANTRCVRAFRCVSY